MVLLPTATLPATPITNGHRAVLAAEEDLAVASLAADRTAATCRFTRRDRGR